jgi:hypothetical protein
MHRNAKRFDAPLNVQDRFHRSLRRDRFSDRPEFGGGSAVIGYREMLASRDPLQNLRQALSDIFRRDFFHSLSPGLVLNLWGPYHGYSSIANKL